MRSGDSGTSTGPLAVSTQGAWAPSARTREAPPSSGRRDAIRNGAEGWRGMENSRTGLKSCMVMILITMRYPSRRNAAFDTAQRRALRFRQRVVAASPLFAGELSGLESPLHLRIKLIQEDAMLRSAHPFRPTALASAIAVATVAALPAQAQSEDGARLENIVVTAAGFEQALRDAPASISVVSREELERRRFSNIGEAIADVPGVDVRSGTGKTGGLNVSIRGMPADYTLILIDGRRQNASGDVTPNGFGETATSFIPPLSAIERIEVIRGPMSTLYGSDAMGGVINIITRRVADEWSGSVAVDTTFQEDRDAGNSQNLTLYTSGPLVEDRLGLQLRGRLFDRDSSERMIPENDTGRDPRPGEARIYSIGGRLNYTPDDTHELWLDLERARQVYDNDDNRLGVQDDPAGRIRGYSDELRFNREIG